MKYIYKFITALALLANISYSQNGSIDLTFGDSGYVRNIPGAAKSIQVSNEKEIFIRGKSSLIKCNPEGEIDLSFGNNGIVEYNLYNLESTSTDMLIQEDGKIVIVGNLVDGATTYVYVLRSNVNGLIDSTFGNNGVFLFNPGNDNYSKTIIQTDDNSFIVGCQTVLSPTSRDFMLLKLSPNGVLDANFGNNGVVVTDVLGKDDFLQRITTDSNNNIYALGHVLLASPVNGINYFEFGLVKYNSIGTLDTAFGNNGKTNFNLDYYSSDNFPNYIKVNDDNSIYVAGHTHDNEGGDYELYKLAKLNSNGSLDQTFGDEGVVIVLGGTILLPSQPVEQVNGKLLINAYKIVYQSPPPTYNNLLTRVNIDGTIDLNFATQGALELDSNFYPRGGLVFQSQNKVLTIGGNADGSGTVLARIIIDDNILNINEQFAENTIIMVPNPSSEVLYISSNENIKYDVEICTMAGKKLISLKNITLNNQKINVSALSSGVYLVKIISESKRIISKKLIIK